MIFSLFFRHNYSDPSKPESSENGNKDCTNEGVVVDASQLYNNSAELNESCDQVISGGETSAEARNEHSKFVIELPRTLKYDCGSPVCDSTPCGIEAGCTAELPDPSSSIVPYVQQASEKGSSDGEAHTHLQGMCQIGQKKEGTDCDWESLMSDATDLLIFNSPSSTDAFKGLIESSLEPITRFCTPLVAQFPENDINDGKEMQIVSIEQHGTADPSSQPLEADQLEEMEDQQNKFDNSDSINGVADGPSEIKDNEVEACMAFACKVKISYRVCQLFTVWLHII